MKRKGHTRPFGTPGSIAEVAYRKLGGVDQWVAIRGASIDNPPLVLLHGGPGLGETAFFRHYNAPLEQHFTVVYWDQRGASKSYEPALPRESLTIEQFVADLGELVDWVRARTGQPRVVLFGHSWGSVLGVLYASRFPDKVSAYVGSGQIGSWAAGEDASYAYALAEARRQHARAIEKKLVAIGPPPHDTKRLLVERTCVAQLDGRMLRMLWDTARAVVAEPEASLLDLRSTLRGFRFTLDALWAECMTIDLRERAPALRVPVFFFLGRKDHWVPPETSVAYFDVLTAPSKQLVWFEQSGHEPFVDEAAKFNAEMIERVLPVVTTGAPARAA
ncbi:MAG: alpha/beta fold hydrolase [Acidobacteriota bacterium]